MYTHWKSPRPFTHVDYKCRDPARSITWRVVATDEWLSEWKAHVQTDERSHVRRKSRGTLQVCFRIFSGAIYRNLGDRLIKVYWGSLFLIVRWVRLRNHLTQITNFIHANIDNILSHDGANLHPFVWVAFQDRTSWIPAFSIFLFIRCGFANGPNTQDLILKRVPHPHRHER